jgi:hypothetical protein
MKFELEGRPGSKMRIIKILLALALRIKRPAFIHLIFLRPQPPFFLLTGAAALCFAGLSG